MGGQAVDAGLVGEDHDLDAIAKSELHHDPLDVAPDGGLLDDELRSDLAVRKPAGDQLEHLTFAPAGTLERPSSGELWIDGRDTAELANRELAGDGEPENEEVLVSCPSDVIEARGGGDGFTSLFLGLGAPERAIRNMRCDRPGGSPL